MYYKRLLPEEYRMLIAIQSGTRLSEVFATAFSDSAMDEAAQASILEEAFQQWAVLGWLCASDGSTRHTTSLGENR